MVVLENTSLKYEFNGQNQTKKKDFKDQKEFVLVRKPLEQSLGLHIVAVQKEGFSNSGIYVKDIVKDLLADQVFFNIIIDIKIDSKISYWRSNIKYKWRIFDRFNSWRCCTKNFKV